MVSNYKVPPKFDEARPYECWKNEVSIWRLVTDLDKKKQALAVALGLEGRARETALEIPAADLNKDDGMETLLAKLDAVFLREEKDRAYEAYSHFDSISKDNAMSMTDYIIDFEQRYNRMKNYNMTLPDAVLAFKLLDTACIEEKSRQLALTACTDLTFASMKSALKRIFGGKASGACNSNETQDAVFFTEQKLPGKFRRSNGPFQSGQQQPQKGTNPLDKYGKRTKCAICQSTYHWAKDCPHRRNEVKLTEDENVEECNITLYTKVVTDSQIFLTESLGSAIIDTACTRTVCGEKWLDSYIKDLKQSQTDKMLQTESPSCRPFRFGDGQVVHSYRKVKLPAKIGQTKCHIETEVVPADIPLLLSKMSLKKAGTVLDMENDRVVMFKQPVPLELTSSGHYCVDIRDTNAEVNCNEGEILVVTADMSTKEKHKILLKLHKQFGHASADRLQRLIQSSGNNDKDCPVILQEIIRDCEICQRYSRTKPKPAVGLPLASEYNETVAMDLHELEPGLWYLHIIDHFTRFSAGNIVRTKKPSEIVNSFMHSWISVHGAPKRIYTDNGGEFNNEEIREMAEKFNIETKTTDYGIQSLEQRATGAT